MADLHDRAVGVIVCAATPQALDHLVAPGHATRVLRVAPDETMFVVAPAFAHDVRRELHDRITALDEDALVLDISDGWSGLALTGADADRALSYLSALDPPDGDGLVQGDRHQQQHVRALHLHGDGQRHGATNDYLSG